jgi:hypothetical protein
VLHWKFIKNNLYIREDNMSIYDKMIIPFLKEWDDYQAAVRFLKKRR